MLPCLFNTFLKQFIKRSKDESDELNTDLSEQEKEERVIKQVNYWMSLNSTGKAFQVMDNAKKNIKYIQLDDEEIQEQNKIYFKSNLVEVPKPATPQKGRE